MAENVVFGSNARRCRTIFAEKDEQIGEKFQTGARPKKIKPPRRLRMSYTQTIALGFFLIIALGTFFLLLPISSRGPKPISFLSALFTATSATCVTGLVVCDTYQTWTIFGQGVILILIQVGGLGFMTIATQFFLVMRRRIGLRARETLSESLNQTHIGGIVRLTKKIILGTLFCEGIGAALLAIRFIPKLGFGKGLFAAIFHAVSAFCNAGFDLMGQEEAYASFVSFSADPLVNITVMLLIIIGGLGFLVWDDITVYKTHFRRYHLHSKIVLSTTAILIFGGAGLFYLFEAHATGAQMGQGERILTAFFSSVTARTAGFNTVDTAALSEASKLLTILLMFIGAAPGSTGGGVKVTTITVLLLYATSYARHNRGTEVFGRQLPDLTLRKAASVFFTNLLLALVAGLIICGVQNLSAIDVLFETFSAIGTVGMTTGITRELNALSRGIILFLMYCGRVGSLSFAMALAEKKRHRRFAHRRKKLPLDKSIQQEKGNGV